MKYLPHTLVIGLSLVLPAGLALAHDSNLPPPPPLGGVVQHRETELQDSLGQNESTTTDRRGMKPPSPEDGRNHLSSTTQPSIRHGEDARRASTTPQGEDKKGPPKVGGGMSGFLHWFLGLPATTTVGDLRDQLNASTTASTSAEHGTPQGLGSFFSRFFGNIGSFFGKR